MICSTAFWPFSDTVVLIVLTSDGFLVAEANPTLTNALESSLWELYSHRQHYHSSVSTLAKIFEEAFTRPSYGMEDFLDHTYNTVCLVPFAVLATSPGKASFMLIDVIFPSCLTRKSSAKFEQLQR